MAAVLRHAWLSLQLLKKGGARRGSIGGNVMTVARRRRLADPGGTMNRAGRLAFKVPFTLASALRRAVHNGTIRFSPLRATGTAAVASHRRLVPRFLLSQFLGSPISLQYHLFHRRLMGYSLSLLSYSCYTCLAVPPKGSMAGSTNSQD